MRLMLSQQTNLGVEEDISAIVLPPHLPPLKLDEDESQLHIAQMPAK